MPDFESLYSECQANAFTSAKKRFYDNKVGEITETDVGGKTVISAVVRGHRDYNTRIIFDEQGGLYDYSCDCAGFNLSDGPCKHIIATALTYEEKNPHIEATPRKYVSDGCVEGLITSYSKLRRGHILREETPVSLVPILTLKSDDTPWLRFVIGKKRMYKLRDINEFCAAVGGGQYHRYGSALAFEHIVDNFDDRSKPLVSFLLRTAHEKEEAKDRLDLSPSDFDDFIDVYDGLIEVEEGGASEGMRQIIRQPDTVRAEISVKATEGGYDISSSLVGFKLLKGKRYDYVMTSGRIYRVTDEFSQTSYKLLSVLNAREKIFVGSRDIGRFYNNVLCEAGKFAEVKSDVDLTEFTVPPLKASLYLDKDGGVVKGRLECSYGDTDTDIFADPYPSDMRDYDAENALKECLAKYFPYFPHLVLESDNDVYTLLTEGVRSIRRFCAVYMTAEMQKISVRRAPGVKVGVKLSGDLIDIDVASDDFTYEELMKIINAASSKKYIRLGDNFVDLDDPGLKALSEIVSINSSLSLPAYYAPHVATSLGEFYDIDTSGCKKLLETDADVEVPASLENVLRSYQKTGLRWLSALMRNGFGGILADDMGLGKSLQIIAFILAHRLKTIIVCPTTLILNWANEFAKFAPRLSILCVMGGQEERVALLGGAASSDVVITSYELIRRDIEHYTMEFDLAVIDEAQYIKNPETKNSRAVKNLKSKYRFALTGTPIENSLSELWSIFDFIMPSYLFSYGKFKEYFEVKIVNGDTQAADELRQFVMPFILRRLKADVLRELPPKIETDIVAPLEGEQATYYNAHLALIRKNLLSDPNVNKITVLTMLTKLRRICCDPSLEDRNYKGNSAKMEACMQLVDSAIKGGHKTLIFSQFTSMLDIIRAELLSRGITNYMLTGDTPKAERMKFVGRFNKDDTQVFLISLRAGGTGLNLTGADVVIHYDPWWNLSVMNQATDRAYRIGQQKSVQVYSLLLGGTLEQKIVELQKRKAKLSGLLEGNLETSELLSLIK